MRTWIFCILIGVSVGYTYSEAKITEKKRVKIVELVGMLGDIVKNNEDVEARDFEVMHRRTTILEMMVQDAILEVANSIDPHIITLDDYHCALYNQIYEEQQEAK